MLVTDVTRRIALRRSAAAFVFPESAPIGAPRFLATLRFFGTFE